VFHDAESTSGFAEVGPNDQEAPGTVLCFAYALPYTYTDLMSDLLFSQKFLLKNGGKIVNQQNQTSNFKKPKTMTTKLVESSVFTSNEDEGLKTPPSKIQRRF